MKPQQRHSMISKINSEINNICKLKDFQEECICDERLSNLKGKTVLVYDEKDFVGNTEPIVKFSQLKDIPNNNSTLKNQNHTSHREFLRVYDCYSNTNFIEEMVEDQNRKLQKYGGYGQNFLHLYSFTLTVQPALRPSPQYYSIELLGNISRAKLPLQLVKMRQG